MPQRSRSPVTSGTRLQLRHLFVGVAAAAVLFALLSATVGGSETKVKVSAFGQSVVLVFMIVGCIGFVFHKRQLVERKAGPPIERFGRVAGRVLNWCVLGIFVAWLLVSAELEWLKAKPGDLVNFIPSPVLLFMATNYAVVRVWWKIDPLGLETCENGLIRGGWHFCPWSDISRYTWSGKRDRQLNLFLKQRLVVPVKIDASSVERLEQILAGRIGGTEPLTAAPSPEPAVHTPRC